MLVVGVSGSPRKAGNTEFLLNEALAVARERGFETEDIHCSELKIDFCTDCGDCSKGRPCPKEDDVARVLATLERADGIIVASPVYFGSITAQLKAIFDRTIQLRRQNFKLKNKIGCAITVGGSRNGGQEKALETVHAWMHIHGMIVVGDDSHFGGIAVRPAAEDRIGRKTVVSSANKLCDLLGKMEWRGGCWAGE
ncbi:MAG: Iron-sulfur flavoprotein [Methanosaeta sp. PtaB.Bin018]|jgi:multimeric flavodoxin WrbA|nr:MAG: Iron-sulfur flavoprotein [Methanosaeta sp. PtaB.Bin018]OPY43526.1 MAG: Iron-sulfur flavoprotein [Methanosaeta sp. PtaU1.Bin016]